MKRFLIDCVSATAFVFGVLWGIKEISSLNLFNAFDPLGQALGDMEFSDIAFSTIREDPPIDTNIVIVNIGELSRSDVARQIRAIASCKPKVIGIDSFFNCPGGLTDSLSCPELYDTLAYKAFGDAIEQAGNVVLVTKLLQTDSLVALHGDIDIYDSLETTDPALRRNAIEGYASLETDAADQEDLKSCRRFNPKMEVNGETLYAFSVQMAMKYDSVKTKKFLARGKKSEIINYRGNIVDWHGASNFASRYMVLDVEQALDTSMFVPSMLKDKIVIMGFLGKDLRDTSWDDKFFTPLNKIYAGKARPDMYGVVVHANIVSMILNEDYIDELQEWQQYAIAILVVMLNVALFLKITKRIPIWFDLISLTVQIIQVLLFSFLMIEFLDWFDFKLDITITLAAVALVGTCFELYSTFLKAFVAFFAELGFAKIPPLTKEKEEV
ncbi:MAG: CHASE2 domain-containing protein [Bacteroidota bacterium]